ncbi:MAG TPA: NHL repeat-containing protein [Woeseiaceae bacterium]
MTSKSKARVAAIATMTLACAATADDQVTGAPNRISELDWLSMPSDVDVGRDGHVYVVDSGHHQVAVFDATGARITSLGIQGGEEGQLFNPLGIDVTSKGEVWIADKGNERIVMFDARGRPKAAFKLQADGEDIVPVDIAVDAKGKELFITSNNTHQVVVFSTKGEFIRAWGGEGEDDGQFRFPATIDIDAAGNVYVVDVVNARVQKFDAAGTHLLTIGERGGKAGTFFRPKGVAVNEAGDVFVSDSFLGVVQVFGADGAFRYVLGDAGTATVFDTPVGLAASGTRLYVTQMLAGKVAVLEPQAPPAAPAEEAAE